MGRTGRVVIVLAVCGVVIFSGCSSYPIKSPLLHGGHIKREHGKPAEGGYYMDFDPEAASLEVVPPEDSNPVMTQHVLVATVKDAKGTPLPSRRVEWLIAEGSVGAIVEVDESGWYETRGYKVNNTYAVTHTNQHDHVLTRGNANPSDDVHLKRGQTWCVITSPIEGDTHVVAYAPAIFNWDKHKVYVVKHWTDAAWQFPPDATNTIGTDHPLAVKVMKASNKAPYEGWVVNFKVVSGPGAVLVPGGKTSASVKTDASGVAKVTLKQVKAVEGANVVEMEVIRPESATTRQPGMRIASGKMTKRWVGPRIGIKKSGPARAGVGEQIAYSIVVSNPGRAAATNVRLTDMLPEGLTYVSSRPAAERRGQKLTWSLGTLAPRASRTVAVTAKTTRTGTFTNEARVVADHGLSARDTAGTVVRAPKLSLQKTGPAEVLFCDPFSFTITVTNTGDGPATNVKINDRCPTAWSP